MAFEEEDPPGAPEWIVTFSDMISLLVTFFVLLLSFASIEAKNEPKMRQLLRGMWGVFPSEDDSAIDGIESVPTPDQTYRVYAALQRHSRPFEVFFTDIEEVGLREGDDRLPIDLSGQVNGVVLNFGDAASFGPGERQPNEVLENALVRTASVISNYPFEVVVEGHSDALPGSDARAGDPEALALARASGAAEILTRSGALDPMRVSLVGMGARKPRAGNKSGHDRRVTLRLVPIKVLEDRGR